MPKRTLIPDDQLARLRARQQAEHAALANHAVAIDRLETAETRRDKLVAEQDAIVAAAREEVRAARLDLAAICGDAAAAELTGTPVQSKRQRAKSTRSLLASGGVK